jgi:hypothetical protein
LKWTKVSPKRLESKVGRCKFIVEPYPLGKWSLRFVCPGTLRERVTQAEAKRLADRFIRQLLSDAVKGSL